MNSICKLEDETAETMFATGSSDKFIKIWRPISDEIFRSKGDDMGEEAGIALDSSINQISLIQSDRSQEVGMEFESKE